MKTLIIAALFLSALNADKIDFSKIESGTKTQKNAPVSEPKRFEFSKPLEKGYKYEEKVDFDKYGQKRHQFSYEGTTDSGLEYNFSGSYEPSAPKKKHYKGERD